MTEHEKRVADEVAALGRRIAGVEAKCLEARRAHQLASMALDQATRRLARADKAVAAVEQARDGLRADLAKLQA